MRLKVVTSIVLITFLASILSIWVSPVAAQPPATEWTKVYGGTGGDVPNSVIETSDGGYAIAGNTQSFGAGSNDFWLVKTDSSGNHQWNKTYGGTGSDVASIVIETSDGGYAIIGYTESFGAGGQDMWLVKTDSSGNHQWNKTYGGANHDTGTSLVQTGDGGYTITGQTTSFGAGLQDFWLVKVDSSGNHQWNKTYGGTNHDLARSLVETSDGGYALAGQTKSFGAGGEDVWFVKTDSSGNHQWNQTYGGAGNDIATSVIETSSGGYALAVQTNSFGAGGYDFWLVKTDSSGNHQWNKTYGGANHDNAVTIIETSNKGYAIAGNTQSFGAGGYDFWLVKTDLSGNHEWNKTCGGANHDAARSAVETSDRGYALAGWTLSYGAGSDDFWLVKVAGPPQYTLTINSSPTGVTFEVNGTSHTTTWSETYFENDSVSLVMPDIHTVGDAKYYWDQWSDGNTSRSRTVTMTENITLTADYTGPYYELTVTSSPMTGITFTVDGVPQTTLYTEWLLAGSHALVMPQTHDEYLFSHWLEDGDPNRIKTITLPGSTWTAVYEPAPPPPEPVGGKATPIVIPANNPELLAPYLGLVTMLALAVATVVYVKRRKEQ